MYFCNGYNKENNFRWDSGDLHLLCRLGHSSYKFVDGTSQIFLLHPPLLKQIYTLRHDIPIIFTPPVIWDKICRLFSFILHIAEKKIPLVIFLATHIRSLFPQHFCQQVCAKVTYRFRDKTMWACGIGAGRIHRACCTSVKKFHTYTTMVSFQWPKAFLLGGLLTSLGSELFVAGWSFFPTPIQDVVPWYFRLTFFFELCIYTHNVFVALGLFSELEKGLQGAARLHSSICTFYCNKCWDGFLTVSQS